MRLILASSSPRRRDLLQAAGIPFQIIPADVEESAPAGHTPTALVLENARLKARHVAALHPDALVLGVDTVVAHAGTIYGKPRDWADAEAMLGTLNGQTHEVFSGVCLVHAASGREWDFVETTHVHFRHLSPEARTAYLRRIGPLDKAGAYAAQDDQGEMIERFNGSFTNVIGLPMERLAEVLAEAQVAGK